MNLTAPRSRASALPRGARQQRRIEALPVLRAAMASGDHQLASAAAFGLRFVPGPDVDALQGEIRAILRRWG